MGSSRANYQYRPKFSGTSPTDQDRGPTKVQKHFKPTLLPDGIIPPCHLKHFSNICELTNAPRDILNIVQGLNLGLHQVPPLSKLPQLITPGLTQITDQELENPLKKGAIQETTTKGFVSPIFLRPKASGDSRLILNLKYLNQFLVTTHFMMEGLKCLRYNRTQK